MQDDLSLYYAFCFTKENVLGAAGFDNSHKIAVSDVPGQIPKSLYQTSYLLPSDFPKVARVVNIKLDFMAQLF